MQTSNEHTQRRARLGITPPRPVNYRPPPPAVIMRLPMEYDHHVRMWHYRNNPQDYTIPRIAQMVMFAINKHVPLDLVKGECRKGDVVEVRQKIWFELRKRRPDLSYPTIGRWFGKDHTSVMSGIKKLEKQGWEGI